MPYTILILKTLFMCIFAIAIRGTVPRYRFDQATMLNWKHFIFVWFIFLSLNVCLNLIFF